MTSPAIHSEQDESRKLPTVAQQTIALFALWNAALTAPGCGTVYVHESRAPGAADALAAWAGAHGLAIEERIYLTDHGNYWSRGVEAAHCDVAVLHYRDATEAEVAAEKRAREEVK